MLLLAAGFAGWLDVNGIGSWADVSGPYTSSTEWPIYLGPDMPSAPDQCIVITPTVRAPRRGADILQSMQVRLRGRADAGRNDVAAKAQDIEDLCYPNGFPRVFVQLGFLKAGQILNGPATLLPADGARRVGLTMNYTIRYRNPVALPPLAGYTLVAPVDQYIKSPDGSIRTLVAMTQAEYDAAAPDPTRAVIIIP
jgi:hypothetical protein